MNRAERRRLKKRMKGQAVHVEKGTEEVDRSKATWCWRHPKLKLENIDDPTPRDGEILETIRLRPVKSHDKNGVVRMGRQCPRCGNFVPVAAPLQSASEESIIILPDKNDANIQM